MQGDSISGMVSYEYIAGFFDGEGFVSIHKANSKSVAKGRSRYWLSISMSNTNKQVIDEIQKIIGGHIAFYIGKGNRQNHYKLALYTRAAYHFLKAIQPYLLIKREEADIAIAFAEFTTKYRYSGVQHRPEVYDFQHKCCIDIMAKHGKGAAAKRRREALKA